MLKNGEPSESTRQELRLWPGVVTWCCSGWLTLPISTSYED